MFTFFNSIRNLEQQQIDLLHLATRNAVISIQGNCVYSAFIQFVTEKSSFAIEIALIGHMCY